MLEQLGRSFGVAGSELSHTGGLGVLQGGEVGRKPAAPRPQPPSHICLCLGDMWAAPSSPQAAGTWLIFFASRCGSDSPRFTAERGPGVGPPSARRGRSWAAPGLVSDAASTYTVTLESPLSRLRAPPPCFAPWCFCIRGAEGHQGGFQSLWGRPSFAFTVLCVGDLPQPLLVPL